MTRIDYLSGEFAKEPFVDKPAAFDAAAGAYDALFSHSQIGSRLRRITWGLFDRYIGNAKLKILEINCGTGEDACHLASQGHHVVATDVSAEMIKVAAAKNVNSSHNPEFFVSDFLQLHNKFPRHSFHVVFSNFGGLNCADERESREVFHNINTVLKPGGKLICVIMGTACIWERVYYLLKGDRAKAFRRKRKEGVETVIGDSSFKTYYYTPAYIRTIMPEGLNFIKQHPVGFFVPPTYLEHYFRRHTGQLDVLHKLERSIKNTSALADMADHYMIVFEKER